MTLKKKHRGRPIVPLSAPHADARSPSRWESEAHFRQLVAMGPAVIYSCGAPPEFPTTFISDNVGTQLGFSPDDFYGDSAFWSRRIHPDDRENVLRELARTEDGEPTTYEYRFKHSDGHYLWLEDQLIPLKDATGKVVGLVGSWFDITSRKRTEAAQAGHNRVLKLLATRGGLAEVLDTLVKTIEEQAPGMLCSVLLYDRASQCLRHGAAPSLPREYSQAVDGISIGPSVGSCGTAAFRAERVIVRDIEQDPRWKDFRELALKHGLRACWSQPIFSSTEELLGTFAMYYSQPRGPLETELEIIEKAADLAGIAIERRRSEQALRESEEQLRQSQKMEAVGQLAGGVAHDFNNILTAIMGFGDLLERKLDPDDAARPYAEEIRKAAERAASITGKLLAFSRKQVLKPEVVDLNHLIREMSDMLVSLVGVGVELNLSLDPDLENIRVDASQIELIIINLAANARDAMPEGGSLAIETRNAVGSVTDVHEGDPETRTQLVSLTMRDTGCGMDKITQSHIFEPFYTTKVRGKGTGLGLATVYGIVNQSGGTVKVTSAPNEGTEFEIVLPAAIGEKAGPKRVAASAGPTTGSETILLVEDERPVRELLCRELREHGYSVLEACDGAEALRVFRRYASQIDLVVTDLIMPHMGGLELIEKLTQSGESIRVMYMSGHTDDHAVRRVVSRSNTQFLQKPFKPGTLVSKVRETLDALRT